MVKPGAYLAMVCAAVAASIAGLGEGEAGAEALALIERQGDPAVEMQIRRDLQGEDLRGKDGPLAGVGGDLARLFREHEAFRRAGTAGAFRPSHAGLPVRGDFVLIDAASNDPQRLRADLEALGLEHGATFRRMVSGLLPIASIPDAAALASLRFARAATSVTHAGTVTSQGDSVMGTNGFRTMEGADGTGITVGVLSDSYNCYTTASDDVLSGDLPGVGNPEGHTTPVEVLDDGACGGDEGRALMQIVHDVAPGAALSFHTSNLGQASFALGIEELAGCPPGSESGCISAAAAADVIVDDVSYFAAPFFQDGIAAQAVDVVVGSGVAYFSSAANSGHDSYESPFVDSGMTLDIGSGPQRAHDFDPGAGVDIFQSVTIPKYALVWLVLQWDQPFFSVGGGAGSQSDFDIVIMDDPPVNVLASSTDANVGGDPVEVIQYVHAMTNTTFNLAILEHDPGQTQPDPGLIKWIAFSGVTANDFPTYSSTTYGHANCEGAEAVGAAFFAETPAFGTNPPLIEPFSSAGGTPILFDTLGVALTTQIVREKPEIVAPDKTNTTFFGYDLPEDPDSYPNFSGTSASAPHAAAYGALLRQLDPSMTPGEVYQHMESTAIDMDDPYTAGFDVGFDFATGYGLIQAVAPNVAVLPWPHSAPFTAWSAPNPFGPAATIHFTLPLAADTRVEVFDTNGRRVRTLVDAFLPAGAREVVWRGRDAAGRPVASGVYFVRIEAGGRVVTRRTVHMR